MIILKINYKSVVGLLILVIPFVFIINSLYVFGEEASGVTTYTESSKTICNKGQCNLVLYSGVKYIYEDKVWKDRNEAKSFKNSGINCVVDFDGSNKANCIDWNETSRTIEFSTTQNLDLASANIPLRKYTLEYNKTLNDFERKYVSEFETSLAFDKIEDKQTLVLKANSDELLEFGQHSTTITLQEADTENLADSLVMENEPTHHYGSNEGVQVYALAGQEGRAYFKFDILTLPPDVNIENATLYLHMIAVGTAGNREHRVYHVLDQLWADGVSGPGKVYPLLTWTSQPCGQTFLNSSSCNLTAMSSNIVPADNLKWHAFDAIDGLKTSYNNGYDNYSIAIRDINQDESSNYMRYFGSKEYTGDVTKRPILNITYSEEINLAPVVQLQFPKDESESTAALTTFYYNVSDPEGDVVENCSLWLNKNQTGFVLDQTDATITQGINQTFIKSLELGNYTWKVNCYDNNTNLGVSAIRNLIIYGINNPPTIDVPVLTPDPAYTDSSLNCSVKAYDIDLNSMIVEFKWYNNSVYTAYQNISTTNGSLVSSLLTSGIQNKNEIWNCTVRAFDGKNVSSFKSDAATILNSIPTHTNPLLRSSMNYNASNEDLICYNKTTQDKDNDKITNIYSWFVNSNPFEVLNMPFEVNAKDYSGNKNGTIYGDPQFVIGKYGKALKFEGVGDKVSVGNLGIGANGIATIEGWFKFSQFAQGSSYKGLYSILYQHPTNNHLYITGTNDFFSVGPNLQLNTWYHIVLTYSGDTSSAKLYLDNQEKSITIQTGAQTIPALSNFVIADTGYNELFNGSIDEVRVYNRVLSANEILEHYNLNYNKIKSTETTVNENWKCKVTPNDGTGDGTTLESNALTIKPNIYDINFSITEGEYGNSLTGVMIACNNGWSVASTTTNPYGPVKFYEGSYSCEFSKTGAINYYNKTLIFLADNNKQINIIMSLKQELTIQEHNWLEAIYQCLYEGNCRALDLLEEINETTENLWDQFKPIDESVVLQEDILSNTLSSTQNISINYTIRVPPKAGYSDGDWLPIKIAYWFLDENNESCKDQDRFSDSNRAEKTYCIPLIAQLLGRINENTEFRIDLRPNLPAGSYSIVRDIEIDPNQIWIKYGQGVIDEANILESNSNANIFLVQDMEVEDIQEMTVEQEVEQSSGLNYVTGLATGAIDETVNEVKAALSGGNVVAIVGMICSLLAIFVVCFTVYKIKTKA